MIINTNFSLFKKKHKNKKNQIIFHESYCKNSKIIEKLVNIKNKEDEEDNRRREPVANEELAHRNRILSILSLISREERFGVVGHRDVN